MNGHRYERFSNSPNLAVALFSEDNDWMRRNRDFLEGFPGEIHLAVPLESWPDLAGIKGANYYGWSHAPGLSEDPRTINVGSNSGYGALGLAYLKGAREIHLVGYDLDPRDEKPLQQFRFWAREFDSTLPQLETAGTKVVNHNPNSFVTAFVKAL